MDDEKAWVQGMTERAPSTRCCGRVINDHARNTAPCYLPDVRDEFHPARVVPEADRKCEVCHRIDNPLPMLLCDGWNLGYHMEC